MSGGDAPQPGLELAGQVTDILGVKHSDRLLPCTRLCKGVNVLLQGGDGTGSGPAAAADDAGAAVRPALGSSGILCIGNIFRNHPFL